MSNEVNMSTPFNFVIQPGATWDLYSPGHSGNKARFFTVNPDPDPYGIEFEPNQMDLEITRVWSTLWVSDTGALNYQWNVRVTNPGGSTAGCRLVVAETDN
jgi:hypothetical protein